MELHNPILQLHNSVALIEHHNYQWFNSSNQIMEFHRSIYGDPYLHCGDRYVNYGIPSMFCVAP